jgi:DHA1 family inner membrane transport protein
MALAALVGAVAGLFLGRHIDRGHGRRAVILAFSAVAGLCLLRALSVGSPWLAVIANAPGAVVGSLLVPAEMTAIYNLAKASPCPLRFHIFTEGAYDIGAAAGCLTAAALAWFGQSLAVSILLGIPGAMAGSALLWRYYGDHPAITKVAIPPDLLTEPPHAP